jgi:peptide/nickel transport system ATP-binding protein
MVLHAGETLALVGESGSGKTTVAKCLLRLIRPTAGHVHLAGEDLGKLSGQTLQHLRREIQIVFQDPYASMNPRMRVAEIIAEGMIVQRLRRSRDDRLQRVEELLLQVGLLPEAKQRYPHEFSGGQRQRICIARALAVEPRILVCDEPTSALDVSVQAQILNLFTDLQRRLGLAYLFITHNLALVQHIAHTVAVMYLGRIVESGPVERVLGSPKHPYTQALLAAVPRIDPTAERSKVRLLGETPSPSRPPDGCAFHPRCPHKQAMCERIYPDPALLEGNHRVHCHLYR